MKNLLALNWKLHKGPKETSAWIDEFLPRLPQKMSADLAIFPPFVSISALTDKLQGTLIAYGAQNVSQFTNGAHTGEVAPQMLTELGCQYVIIGHSERRNDNCETDHVVAAKLKAALAAGLSVVLCVGESITVREAGLAEEFVLKQLDIALENLANDDLAKISIAYEPIWAIGTGKNANPQDAEAMSKAIRDKLAEIFSIEKAKEIKILYGGSVKADNIASFCQQENINGALVGGASLEIDSVLKMINALEV